MLDALPGGLVLPRRGRRAGAGPGGGALLALGAAVVGLLAVAALAAPWLAPHDPAIQLDPVAGRYLPPGSERIPLVFADGRRILVERAERRGGEVAWVRQGKGGRTAAAELANLPTEGVPGTVAFHLGTDRFGRDVWSRLLHGARVSLSVGLLAALLAISLGVLVGAAAAAGGPVADALLMRLVDAVLSFPRLFLLLSVVALFRPGATALVLVLGGTAWMAVSRLVRAEVQALARREFALAARAQGQHPLRVLVVHLLPNALTPLLVAMGLLVADVILVESSLSFLGLGVPPPAPSWGSMVASGTDALTGAWWVATFPGIAIAVTVLGFNLLADGLRDVLDPRIG